MWRIGALIWVVFSPNLQATISWVSFHDSDLAVSVATAIPNLDPEDDAVWKITSQSDYLYNVVIDPRIERSPNGELAFDTPVIIQKNIPYSIYFQLNEYFSASGQYDPKVMSSNLYYKTTYRDVVTDWNWVTKTAPTLNGVSNFNIGFTLGDFVLPFSDQEEEFLVEFYYTVSMRDWDDGILTVFTMNNDNNNYKLSINVVPEPSALSLLAVGLSGLALMVRRRS
jgi:hypothetical protein